MTSPLDLVLRHNAWANKTLLDHCAALAPSALELSAPGTYGTLQGTLQHLVAGEQWYLFILTGKLVGTPIRETERATIDQLIAVADLTGARALEIAGQDDAERVLPIRDERSTVGTVIAQLVHHGNEHRAHVNTILGANHLATRKIGAWSYGMALGISNRDGD